MLLQDLRFAARMLAKRPAFTAVAAASLALGIGANSAMFSFADALLLRPLPVRRPSEIVTVSSTAPDSPIGAAGSLSYPDYLDYREKSDSFDGLTAFTTLQVGLSESPDSLPQYRVAMVASGNLFRVMGVEPALGRAFTPGEDAVPGRDAVLVLGHDAWKQRFGADPNIAGRRIRLNGVECTILGVAPEQFTGMDTYLRPDVFVPAMMLARIGAGGDPLEDRGNHMFTVKGRLKPEFTRERAGAELAAIARGLAAAYPATNRNRSVLVRTETEARIDRSPGNAALVAMLMGIVGLVLMIACANVANLLLSRSQSRSHEMSVRLAVGAGRGRLIRQLLIESLLLALLGGALGLFVADSGVRYLSSIRIPTDLPIVLTVVLDRRALLFSLLVSMACAVIFGLAPAIQTTRTDLVSALRISDPAAAVRGRWLPRGWGRNTLVAGQVALSLMLLVAAAMFYRSFRAVLVGSPGFRTDHLLMMGFDPSLARYKPEQTREFYRSLSERALRIPGVVNASLSQVVPMGTSFAPRRIVPEGFQFAPGRDRADVFSSIVDERYFDTLATPILRGRAFQTSDDAARPRVAVVNQALAEKYWPGRDAVGKRFRLEGPDGPWVEVVGLAKTAKHIFIGESPQPVFYLPLAQNPQPRMTLFLHSAGDPAALTEPLRQVVRSIDPHQPVYDVRTMGDFYRQRALGTMEVIVVVFASIGLMGFALALVGLYGLMAYTVSRRTREIGIRMAVGAGQRQIIGIVVRQGFWLAAAGVAAGLAGSVAVVRIIVSVFSEMRGAETSTFVLAPLALLAAATAASFVPAWRAARVDPNITLRAE